VHEAFKQACRVLILCVPCKTWHYDNTVYHWVCCVVFFLCGATGALSQAAVAGGRWQQWVGVLVVFGTGMGTGRKSHTVPIPTMTAGIWLRVHTIPIFLRVRMVHCISGNTAWVLETHAVFSFFLTYSMIFLFPTLFPYMYY
jgi:hypothetical protein